jgi:hypothetical protein
MEKTFTFFEHRWYIREDLHVEQFEKTRHILNCNIMLSVGNCFDSREDALKKCNEIRGMIGVDPID